MALVDPQNLPTTPEATALARISSELGKFGSEDLTYELTVDHSRNSRNRHVIKLVQRKISQDPLLPSQNREYAQSVHIVIDHPKSGFSASEVDAFVQVFQQYLGTAGLIPAVVQGQA